MSERFSTRIRIADRYIGPEDPVYVIAEIGANHNQDIGLAKALIDAAKDAGADAAKFQSLRYDKVHLTDLYDEDFARFFAQIELKEDWYDELAAHCRQRQIHFFSSATYLEAVDLLVDVGAPGIKIASAQFDIYPELVERAARTGLPLVMSTGLADYGGIERMLRLVREAGNRNVVLLHCVTEYPAIKERVNLRLIETYRRVFGCLVGFSDHTLGTAIPVAAVALGAVAVEKHLTLDRSAPGPDHHFAATPSEFAEMVQQIREVESALGDGVKADLNEAERAIRDKFLYKWVAAQDLKKGQALERDLLILRRAPGGIPQQDIGHLLGHRLEAEVPAGRLLEWKHLVFDG